MEKLRYPNWFIGRLSNEEYKKKTRNGEVKSNFDMVEFICDKDISILAEFRTT